MAMNYEKKNVSMAKLFVDGEEEEFVILSVSEDENDDNNNDLDLSLSLWEFVDVPESDQQAEPLSDEEKVPEKEDREIQSESESETETEKIEDQPQEESSLFLVQEVFDHRDEDADRDRALGLNDDLVPWNVSDKFGNQRLKKMGMRGFQKVHGPKRSSHSATKRGGSKGKRGSGLKRGH